MEGLAQTVPEKPQKRDEGLLESPRDGVGGCRSTKAART